MSEAGLTSGTESEEGGAPAPLIVGIGGTTRPNSSTERVVGLVLDAARQRGARVRQFTGPEIAFALYTPDKPERCAAAQEFISTLRQANGVVIGSPGYHGSISGLVKNALDYIEDMARDRWAYLDGMAVGCVATGAGWQGAHATLNALRTIVHSLRGWPTPLGIAVNTIEPLFESDGSCKSQTLKTQVELMADQIIGFAQRSKTLARDHR
jgi:FMN reductase